MLSLKKVFYIISITFLLAANTLQADVGTFDLKNYQGKVVYLDFWASWCVPCRKSFPWLNQLRNRYSEKQLVIVAVNLDKEAALAADFLKQYPANFDIFYDPEGVLAKMVKPGQEERIDLPTIGPETIRLAAGAGLAGIVAESGRAFVLERETVIAMADEAGLFIHGILPEKL